MLHHQALLSVSKAICMELISWHHDKPQAGYFGIEKTCELLTKKYYWSNLRHNVEAYMKNFDICLASKAFWHKPYSNLQSLPVRIHQWKNLSMDFVTCLPISTNCK